MRLGSCARYTCKLPREVYLQNHPAVGIKSSGDLSLSLKPILTFVAVCLSHLVFEWTFSEAQPVTLANTETFELSSETVGDTYFIKVAYPRDYHSSTKRYPVLYVTDAETNFGALQYVAQRLAKDKLIPELIVGGIAYDADFRVARHG